MQSSNARGGPCEFIKAMDMYGEGAKFTFRRKNFFNSWLGTLFTIIAFGLFLASSLMRTLKLITAEEPFLSTVTIQTENLSGINL